MYKAHETLRVDPETARQMEIVEEVKRRRQQDEPARLRHKSDAIFGRFDVDGDGFLNFAELSVLGAATGGGELSQLAYGAVCHEIGADAARGVTCDELFKLYTDADMGDANRDYNLIFRS